MNETCKTVGCTSLILAGREYCGGCRSKGLHMKKPAPIDISPAKPAKQMGPKDLKMKRRPLTARPSAAGTNGVTPGNGISSGEWERNRAREDRAHKETVAFMEMLHAVGVDPVTLRPVIPTHEFKEWWAAKNKPTTVDAETIAAPSWDDILGPSDSISLESR